MPSSAPRRSETRFCLDANLSYRVAAAVDPSTANVIHISQVAGLSVDAIGRSDAPDESVARWCAANEVVLVTCDDDFRGRAPRASELTRCGAEVIVFSYQVTGLQNQVDTIARRIASWKQTLEALPYGERVWIQYQRGRLRPDR